MAGRSGATSQDNGSNTNVIVERLENLRVDIAELKGAYNLLNVSNQQFQRDYIAEHTKVVLRLDNAHDLIGRLDRKVCDMEKAIVPLVTWGKVAAFVFSALGVSVIGLIWSILTHSVTLAVP